MTAEPAQKPHGHVVLACAAFLVLVPLLVVQVRSEWGQVAVALLGAVALGAYLGRVRIARSPKTYVVYGAVLGAALWLVLLVVARVAYPGAVMFPGTWLVRFGLGSALVLAASAALADRSARGLPAQSLTVFTSLVTLAGGVLALVKG